MASAQEREAAEERRGRFLELLMGSGSGPDGDPFVFFPILVGVMGPPRGGETDSSPPADRIVLVNPMTQGMVVLPAGGGSPDLAAVVQEILAAEGGARGPPPASKASIEAMRAVETPTGEAMHEVEHEECAVCLDGLWSLAEAEEEVWGEKKKVDVVKEMPCKHRFHGGCIEKWLGKHGSCPVCRYQMPEEKQPEQKKEGWEREQERRRGLEREIWITLGFSSRAAEQLQQPQQRATEEEDRGGP